MSDHKEKAKNLKFAFFPKMQETDYFLFGYSLKFGATFGMIALICQEALLHYYLTSLPMIIDIVYTYLVIWSAVRMLIAFATINPVSERNFNKVLKRLKAVKVITALQIFNSLVVFLLALFRMDIGLGYRGEYWEYRRFYYNPEQLIYPGLVVLFIIGMDVYFYYVLFSFTKHLGLGNEALIVNNRPVNIPQAANLDPRNTSAFLPANNQSSSSLEVRVNEFSQYPNLEKIVLNYPNDITFAQSAQNAIVNNLALPSGFKIPPGRDGKSWKIEGNEILLV
jgi:hypothetical protein